MIRKTNAREKPPPDRRKRISEEEASVRYRYGSVRVLRDGRVRFSPKTLPGLAELDFSVEYACGLGDGTYVFDRVNYSVDARWPGNESFFVLWVVRHRVQSACFNFSLTPEELRKAVTLLRRAGGGLHRWIVPGLEQARDSLAQVSSPGSKTLKAVHELLEATQDLPVAEPWRKQRRSMKRALPR